MRSDSYTVDFIQMFFVHLMQLIKIENTLHFENIIKSNSMQLNIAIKLT